MSVISDLLAALLGRGSDKGLRVHLRDELLAAGSWDHPLLLEYVLAHPAADGPRLLLADWLEEDGEGVRADFIRLQCRWALLLDVFGAGGVSEPDAAALRARLAALLPVLTVPLAAGLVPIDQARVALDDDGGVAVRGGGITLDYRRGFVGRVELPTPTFLSRVTDLFRAHPITSVRLTDKNPVLAIGKDWWWADSCLDPTEPACLARYVPPELYCFLSGSVRRDGRQRQGVNPADLTFATPQAAYAALSTACVNFGRLQAAREGGRPLGP